MFRTYSITVQNIMMSCFRECGLLSSTRNLPLLVKWARKLSKCGQKGRFPCQRSGLWPLPLVIISKHEAQKKKRAKQEKVQSARKRVTRKELYKKSVQTRHSGMTGMTGMTPLVFRLLLFLFHSYISLFPRSLLLCVVIRETTPIGPRHCVLYGSQRFSSVDRRAPSNS